MNLYIRLLIVMLGWFKKPRLGDMLDTGILRFRVWPNDLDFNMHMNNGRYLTLMDLGRIDLIRNLGLLKIVIERKYGPVLAAAHMRWRLPLRPFQTFDLQTRILCWDDKWFFMEQRFVIASGAKKGAVAAIGILKGSFFDPSTGTTVPSADLLKLAGMEGGSPAMPAHVARWQEAEDALRDLTAPRA